MMDQQKRMKELIGILNRASKAYYAEDREIMSDHEYDKLYDELVALEAETGMILAGSPTQTVGYEAVDELPKEAHERPMLSLAKTKSREELADWLGDKEGLLSWKLDGLTIVLTYEGGVLQKAVTRGNGEIGEVITPNAKTFVNLPMQIPYQGRLVLRGEAVIPYSVFEKINAEIPEEEARYKNPRNLCSGSVRQLDSAITAKRQVSFYAFSFVISEAQESEGGQADYGNDRQQQFEFLRQQGFDVVEYHRVNRDNILDRIEYFAKTIEHFDIPSDGLVLTYCDLAYSASLGRTAKFPRDSIAFKWADELAETTLREIEWSPSRTGLINPVAIFDPVELEGTTVSRASVHNISIMKALHLGIGDRITVYKANMIIPQIAENLTKSDRMEIPDTCPACGGRTKIVSAGEATGGRVKSVEEIADTDLDDDAFESTETVADTTEVLYCINPDCPAKAIMGYTQFVSRNAMNIDGLSEKTLEKFISLGYLRSREFADLYHLSQYKDEICKLEGFGEKSYENLIAGIDASRKTAMYRVVFALGIAGIGEANAKLLSKHFGYDIGALRKASVEELSSIDKIGGVLANSIVDYFADRENNEKLDRLLAELQIEVPQVTADDGEKSEIYGKTFVVTGSVHHFANRDELKALIESKGGKVTGSVTGKTDYLINNDITSMSGKNKKAKELGIPIIDEETFLKMAGE
ncbi:MAG: NAD-dependent DNA ligase LigA [Lachnospiraceae bacterium]|nr:NAD-dependent DNA ligase LigA [Lachnospiraceae bacterium]